jgi:hypothetical protein
VVRSKDNFCVMPAFENFFVHFLVAYTTISPLALPLEVATCKVPFLNANVP